MKCEHQLHLEGVRLLGIHGYYPHERLAKQPFIISLKLGIDLSAPANTDDLRETVDWDWIVKQLHEVIEGPPHNLVESLAEKILTRLHDEKKIIEAEVTISKTEAWSSGTPSIQMYRCK